MAMLKTTTEALDALFRPTILGLTPRPTCKGGEAWSGYTDDISTPTKTRRFRLVWFAEQRFERGNFTPDACEYIARFAVRTDYSGKHADMQHVIIDDHAHLNLALARLRGDTTGVYDVVSVEQRKRSPSKTDSPDVVQIDHVFTVRYLRALTV